jgi:hypothetical protein
LDHSYRFSDASRCPDWRNAVAVKTSVENGYTWFSKGGFEINATFFDGKADAIGFRKERKDVLGTSEEMSGNEIQLLLDANSNGKTWAKDNVISMDKNWSTEDGTLKATYISFKHVLVVCTKENIQRFSKAKAAEEATKLEGQ